MRLSDFIVRNMESILAKWEIFAATRLPAAASMASLELRDHAQQILEAVAADLSTKAWHRGLGLGLYIVRDIAKGHGGTAEARSDDRETVFTVRFPRTQ